MLKSLSGIELNQKAIIDSMNQEKLNSDYILELLDFGFLPGTEISVLQKYPSQNKIVVQIGRAHLSLRLNDASFIQVRTNGN
ncbi:MAG TPA: FeoA family protein [Leptospiraceae bacterium]|nr:FeoA family protein [Leptospiraceae bacterium]HMW07852.1 FeoA family protein [Leptospiraceae bacterium]HMX32338.1 FeoA family protein [Leptospiraceae bacterium]HMY32657.1 FeoA family protein [Leptospiraceae bacterium]HMZ66920.1 FeoA family protein [Leptospiraceae bacterium]